MQGAKRSDSTYRHTISLLGRIVLGGGALLALTPGARAGDIFVADRDNGLCGNGGVVQVDPATAGQNAVVDSSCFVNPSGVALDANDNLLIVDDDAFGGAGGIVRVDLTTGAETVVSSGAASSPPGVSPSTPTATSTSPTGS